MAVDLALLAMGLTAIIGILGAVFGLQFEGKYKAVLKSIYDASILLNMSAKAAEDMSKALEDNTLTEEEIRNISINLTCLKESLEKIRDQLQR